MSRITLEICVDTLEGAEAAVAGGADRIELCAALSEGGLTPSAGLMAAAARLPVPVVAMIRPRGGDFVFSHDEIRIMEADIATARAAGLAGVVLGAATQAGTLDLGLLARLSHAAGPLERTLHRVTDLLPDPLAAVDPAAALGFARILTSGGAATARDGTAKIAEIVRHARGRVSILPGGGISAATLGDLVARTGVTEIHSSCSTRAEPGPFDPPGGLRRTSREAVRALRAALDT